MFNKLTSSWLGLGGAGDHDRFPRWRVRVHRMAVVGAFERPFRHFVFDHPRIGSEPALVGPFQYLLRRLGGCGGQSVRGKRPPDR